MYFADFRAQMGIEETPYTWTIGYSLGKNHFFVEKYDKKMAKIGTIFLNFLQFFVFFFCS